MNMKIKHEKLLYFIGITFYSIMIFAILLAKNKDAFYVDDNIMQWGPVTRRAFDEIFSGKGIPYVNFYQYKGIDIFSSGYYGLINPFMYISYILSRFVFSYELETLVIYEWLMYWLGLLMMCRLLKDFSLKPVTIVISLLAYSTTVIFFEYAHYYFTFNNFLLMPLLLWIIMNTRCHKTRWFFPGIIFAFSLLMGHVQYSCYYVMVYCIIQVVFSVQDKKPKTLLPVFTNIGLFAALSICLLSLSLVISKDRSEILSNNSSSDFFLFPVSIEYLFDPIGSLFLYNEDMRYDELNRNVGLGIFAFFAFMPLVNIYKKLCKRFEQKIYEPFMKICANKSENIRRIIQHLIITLIYVIPAELHIPKLQIATHTILLTLFLISIIVLTFLSYCSKKDFMLTYKSVCICLGLLLINIILYVPFIFYLALIIFYVILCQKKKVISDISTKERCIHAFMFAGIFFVLFGSGAFGIATILSKIPVIKDFRFLYKCVFIYVPILIVCGAVALDKIEKKRRILYCASAVFSVIAFVNIVYVTNSGLHAFINNPFFDYQDYRNIEKEVNVQMVNTGIDKNYRFMTISDNRIAPMKSRVEISSKICAYAMTKNFCTVYGTFSLAGYDNIFTVKGFKQSDKLISSMYTEGMFCNMVCDIYKFQEYIKSEEELALFESQIIENGVKYILIPNDQITEDIFKDVIDHCENISISNKVSWTDNYDLLELDGVNPICSYGGSEELPLETSLDELSFHTDFSNPETVTISMTYNPHYIIRLTDTNGNVTEIKPTESKSGYNEAEIPAGSYDVEFTYKNNVMDAAVILAIITILLTAAAITTVSISKKDSDL